MSSVGIPIIGIIGGVGSGKSTLAAWLSRALRVEVLDADAAGHAALREPAVQADLRRTFGAAIFSPAGEVDRRQLARFVFGDTAAHVAARRQLEAIVHPVIRHDLERQIAAVRRGNDCDLIILDAAVMLEAGWSELCDAIVYVDSPRSGRLERVRTSRGWSEADLDCREASQWPLDRKRAAADLVIDNSGDVDAAGRSLLRSLRQRFPQLGDHETNTRASAPLIRAAN